MPSIAEGPVLVSTIIRIRKIGVRVSCPCGGDAFVTSTRAIGAERIRYYKCGRCGCSFKG